MAGNEPSNTFGPVEDSDATRQAQHGLANDAPVDVNVNAIIARTQGLTFDALGKGFASNQDRRDKMFDQMSYQTKPQAG